MNRDVFNKGMIFLFSLLLVFLFAITLPSCGGDSGGSDNPPVISVGNSTTLVDGVFNDPEVHNTLESVGDGMTGKRAALSSIPEVQALIDGGSETAEAMIEKFGVHATPDADDNLFLFAYALEQMNYTDAVDPLADFLSRNLNGGYFNALSGATNALRVLTGRETKVSGYYMITEILETLDEVRNNTPFQNEEPIEIELIAGSSSGAVQANAGGADIFSCTREFVFRKADGDGFLEYPSDYHDVSKRGKTIVVDGFLYNPAKKTVPDIEVEVKKFEVESGGGTYVTNPPFVDTQSGQTFQGSYSATFDCSGFAFREFNDGYHWWNDPGEWFDAFTGAKLLEEIPQSQAGPGDFIFWWGKTDTLTDWWNWIAGAKADMAKHVGVVDSALPGGGIQAINADGTSGLFRAPLDAAWYNHYSTPRFFRWKSGQPPALVENPAYTTKEKCKGCDTNGDGYPDLSECTRDCPHPIGCDSILDISISANPQSTFENDEVFFNSTVTGGSGGPYLYLWEFDDGATSTLADNSHSYANAGTYTVWLTVTDMIVNENDEVMEVKEYASIVIDVCCGEIDDRVGHCTFGAGPNSTTLCYEYGPGFSYATVVDMCEWETDGNYWGGSPGSGPCPEGEVGRCELSSHESDSWTDKVFYIPGVDPEGACRNGTWIPGN